MGDHVSFVPETGALLLRSVSFRDSGDYLCLVNNKRENGQVRLMVQGKKKFFLRKIIFILSTTTTKKNPFSNLFSFHLNYTLIHTHTYTQTRIHSTLNRKKKKIYFKLEQIDR